MPGCHSHNLSTIVLLGMICDCSFRISCPTEKQIGMIWLFSNLHLICHYVQKNFLTGLVNPGGTDAISEQKGKHPPGTESFFFFLRTGYVQQHITFADLQISNGSLCFASAAMAPVKNKSMLIEQSAVF